MKRRGDAEGTTRPRQRARRRGDARASHARADGDRSGRGLTLLECLVALALVGILMGIAVPKAPRRSFTLWTAQQQLLGDLRQTRADALTKGDHFVLELTDAQTYAEYRMELQGTEWVVVGPPVRSRTLPPGVTFAPGDDGQTTAEFEFNTRGLLVLPDGARSIRLVDAHTSAQRQITVWPSGQVAPL